MIARERGSPISKVKKTTGQGRHDTSRRSRPARPSIHWRKTIGLLQRRQCGLDCKRGLDYRHGLDCGHGTWLTSFSPFPLLPRRKRLGLGRPRSAGVVPGPVTVLPMVDIKLRRLIGPMVCIQPSFIAITRLACLVGTSGAPLSTQYFINASSESNRRGNER